MARALMKKKRTASCWGGATQIDARLSSRRPQKRKTHPEAFWLGWHFRTGTFLSVVSLSQFKNTRPSQDLDFDGERKGRWNDDK
jgi:hypothetical protein